jgi:undecaprenyl-diphosphatase
MVVAITALAVLKNYFQITRPGTGLMEVNGWSFPSGHATVATAFFFSLAHIFIGRVRSSGKKILLVIGSILGAGLICFSRLYLGAHWTLDILAGVALGLLSVSFTVLLFNVFLSDFRSLRTKINL